MTTRRGFLKFLGLAPAAAAVPAPAVAEAIAKIAAPAAPAIMPLATAPVAAAVAAATHEWVTDYIGGDDCSMTRVILMEPRPMGTLINQGPK